MVYLNDILNRVFDALLRPLQMQPVWPLLFWISALTAAMLVLLFALTSNQTAILQSRNRFLARSMELLMFQHDLRVSFSACGRILAANGRYLSQFLLPMTATLLPLLIIMVQADCWLGYQPLKVGEQAVLTVQVDSEYPVTETPLELRLSDTLQLDSPAVRTPSTNEVAWRIRATGTGQAWADVVVAGSVERKSVATGATAARVSTRRESNSILNQFLWPSEPPLEAHSPVRRIQLAYPHRRIFWNTTEVSWMTAMLGLTIGMSLVFGRLLGVRVA